MSKDVTEVYSEATIKLVTESLANAMTYIQYRGLVATLAQEGKATGVEQTEALINYTKLNDRRMKRWDKTLKFSDEVVSQIQSVDQKINWIVLTESWCGDASPALPVMHKITELNPNISLRIILRDEHNALMNQFLTNGSMSIPKLIAVDESADTVLSTWGPRSANATQLVEDYKKQHGKLTSAFKQDLQVWYNKDKGQSVLVDILELLPLK